MKAEIQRKRYERNPARKAISACRAGFFAYPILSKHANFRGQPAARQITVAQRLFAVAEKRQTFVDVADAQAAVYAELALFAVQARAAGAAGAGLCL